MNFIYNYFSKLELWQQKVYTKKIYTFLFMLNFKYPDFKKWYDSLFENDNTLKKNREIIFCVNSGEIAGVAILKKTEVEDKICTLRVSTKYEKLGLGRSLLEKSMEYLQNDKPLITLHISMYHKYKNILNRYGFILEQEISCCYGLFKSELVYNGQIKPQIIYSNNKIINSISKLEKFVFNYPEDFQCKTFFLPRLIKIKYDC